MPQLNTRAFFVIFVFIVFLFLWIIYLTPQRDYSRYKSFKKVESTIEVKPFNVKF